MSGKVAVVGIGNIAFRDDGVGLIVVEALAQEQWPPNIQLVDIGVAIHNLDVYLYDKDYAILVQAFRGGFRAGHVHQLEHDELSRLLREGSCPCVQTFQVLRLMDRLGFLPREITFIGIEPRMVCFGLGLSKEVRVAVRRVINLVRRNLLARGYIEGTPRVVPLSRYRVNVLGTTISL